MNKPDSLYYITHLDNLPSILEKGILPRSQVQGVKHQDIHDPEVLARRNKTVSDGKMLGDYVNLYFQPRNAMLFRLVKKIGGKKLVVLQIKPNLIEQPDTVFSNRNAATFHAQFFTGVSNLKKIDGKVFHEKYWTRETKQKMMAEVLVPRPIGSDEIMSIYVSSKPDDGLKKLAGHINIINEPELFFAPTWQKKLTDTISLAQGDMFFSTMQTLTISVNLKGVMGKGLASRTKYQFPYAYVRYQDDCRSRKLKIGKPTLFKRDISIEEELADDANQLEPSKRNGPSWFLFFPTKRHWREPSHLEDIEKSMQWLVKNYKKEGIQSIALPALGCGLGNLSWRDVGPMMCRYLAQMDIQCCIYLPLEEMPDKQWLEKSHLLNQQTKQSVPNQPPL